MLLTHHKLLQSKAITINNDLRGTLRNFGLKVGMVGTVRFEARIKELVENLPDLAALVEPLLIVRRTLREQFCILHRRLLVIVRDDEIAALDDDPWCRSRDVADLSRRATVDVRARFRKSKSVRAVFGLTLRQLSIRRGGLERQNIALWRRDDAGHALRRWKDVRRGTMDEVSSHVRLDLPFN